MIRARPLLGTIVEISAESPPVHAIDAAFAAIAGVHARMSFHEPGSDLSRLNARAAQMPVRVSPLTFAVLHAAQRFHRASQGLFDCTVARELVAWQLLPGELPEVSLTGGMEDVLMLPDCHVSFRRPLLLDLGGIAKGFAVDMAIHALRRAGVQEACVNAGGDLRVIGRQARLMHVRAPDDPQRLVPVGCLSQGAMATSGIYHSSRCVAGREVSALVDAGSRQPLLLPRSYTVLARTCMVADALTKVLARVGDPGSPLLRRFGAEGLVL